MGAFFPVLRGLQDMSREFTTVENEDCLYWRGVGEGLWFSFLINCCNTVLQAVEKVKLLVTQWCVTLCDPMDWGSARFLCPPGKKTGVGCHFLLQGNLPNPGIEPRSPALWADSLPPELPGSVSGSWGSFIFSLDTVRHQSSCRTTLMLHESGHSASTDMVLGSTTPLELLTPFRWIFVTNRTKGRCFWVFRSTFYFKGVYLVFINCSWWPNHHPCPYCKCPVIVIV